LEATPGKLSIDSLQKSAVLGTSHIIRNILQSETGSLSGWFRSSTREERHIIIIIIIIIINIKGETVSTIVAAQDQAISTNYLRNKILKEEIESKCR
jgi:hypothetical protein